MSVPIGKGGYTLVYETDPLDLSRIELAVLMAIAAQLTELSGLPDFHPTAVTVQLTFAATGHVGCARLALPENAK